MYVAWWLKPLWVVPGGVRAVVLNATVRGASVVGEINSVIVLLLNWSKWVTDLEVSVAFDTPLAGQRFGVCQMERAKLVGGVYAHKRGWRARMTIQRHDYVAPSRATRDLAAADLAEIRSVVSVDEVVRTFRRLHERRAVADLAGLFSFASVDGAVGLSKRLQVARACARCRKLAWLHLDGRGWKVYVKIGSRTLGALRCVTRSLSEAVRAEIRAVATWGDAVRVGERLREFLLVSVDDEARAFARRQKLTKVHLDGKSWKAHVKINKKTLHAPRRATRAMAEADLAEIRAAPTRDEVVRVVERLKRCRVKNLVVGVCAHGNGWRADVKIKRKRYRGPCRASRALAEADLVEIRGAATRGDVARVVQRLRESRVARVHAEACAFAKCRNASMEVHSDVAGRRVNGMENKKNIKSPPRATRDVVEADLADIRVVAPGKAAVRVCRRLSVRRAR